MANAIEQSVIGDVDCLFITIATYYGLTCTRQFPVKYFLQK